MNRVQFMEQLKKLLSDISEEERQEALEYYESYFDDAGEDQEAEVIRELGSPGKVAAIIKEDLKSSSQNDMYPEFWTHIYKLGGHHGCFSVFYRRHPFCFCLDSFAIIVINIFINSNCKFFK